MTATIIPAFTVPASRSYDGLDRIVPEQVITNRKQPRRCTWCAVEFVPKQPSGSRTARFCGKSCAGKMRRSLQDPDRPNHLREVIMEQLGRLTPRSAAEVYVRVLGVWGEISDRAVYRHLSQLHRDGRVVRTPDGYMLAPSPRSVAAGVSSP